MDGPNLAKEQTAMWMNWLSVSGDVGLRYRFHLCGYVPTYLFMMKRISSLC